MDGDSYLSYYLGLIFDTFLFKKRGVGGGGGRALDMHIVVLSLSHFMPGGPYGDVFAVDLIRSCNTRDYSMFTQENCTDFVQLVNDVGTFSDSGDLYHKNLALVVLNDAVIMASYSQIALKYFSLHNTSLFAIIHLNHEQPWVDNQSQSTETILAAYRATRLVFRTHYFSDFMAVEGVHYLPLGPGLLQTERMALGLTPRSRRFPPARELQTGAAQPPSHRLWLCSFAGSTKYQNNSRAEMLQTLQGVPGCVFRPTDDTAVSAPLTQKQYMKAGRSISYPYRLHAYRHRHITSLSVCCLCSNAKMDSCSPEGLARRLTGLTR